MGGHAAGEVASAMTVEAIYNGFLTRPTIEGLLSARRGPRIARSSSDAKANPERFGMGTTVIVVGLTHDGNWCDDADHAARGRQSRLPIA